ncbi:hypothetical protein [Actinomadura xylanilytica]|uniref:hypothetical protein n=1 Tax=Actinomadura xylanilytica TaxID=887459 RepID=UPI00255AF2E7|nr:hypothetical protein [Actinomadura xylanilytica]MDL4775305.1 hypothetical protein [Actinomadura xylanilytica]
MKVKLAPWALRWDEVDPGRIPFDAAGAWAVVSQLRPAMSVPVPPKAKSFADRALIEWSYGTGQAWTDEMTYALVERYGRWTLGWRWARAEGDVGGGPVGAWCCPRDSMTKPVQTLRRVTDGLVEWRGWLEDLAQRFERFPLDDRTGPERRRTWEEGAAHLVTAVVEQTGAGDAWYGHCRQVLAWFLARWDIPEDQADELVHEAVAGRFESWVAPSSETVEKVAARLAESLPSEA